ncbi:hypothetical protein BJ170DRAFT_711601 [Xylariales sp. AK1849]|nr:hypothetical protein BJ170DRAFT_711601 [Xylariales sp. AK1849]
MTKAQISESAGPLTTPLAVLQHAPLATNIITGVDHNLSGGYYGPADVEALATHATAFICSNSNANALDLRQALQNFLALTLEDCAARLSFTEETKDQVTHSCWLCIRMTLPTDAWIVPRWHKDGRMFQCSCPEPKLPHSKYAFTILGPSTRVMTPSPQTTAILETPPGTGRRWNFNESDPGLAMILAQYPETKVKLGQTIRFSWGQQDSPIHSEPDSSCSDRVFRAANARGSRTGTHAYMTEGVIILAWIPAILKDSQPRHDAPRED